MGPFQSQILENVLESSRDLPEEVRQIFEQMQGGLTGGAVMGAAFIFSLFFSLFFYSIFGLLGGLLGATMFRKNMPPPAAATEHGIYAADVHALVEQFPAAAPAAAAGLASRTAWGASSTYSSSAQPPIVRGR